MRKCICKITFLAVAICLLCVLLCGSALTEETEVLSYPEIPVYVDGMLLCRGYSINGENYVDLQTLGEVLGYEPVTVYDKETDRVTVYVAGIDITVRGSEPYLTANGRCLYLPNGIYRINGAALFPADIAAKIFGLGVAPGADGGIDFDTANEAILESGDTFYNADDLYWMSRIITQESGNQPVEGQIAVGNVVLNRVASSRFPGDIKSVIFQTGQFSPVQYGTIYRDPYPISVICAKLVFEGYKTVDDDVLFFQVGRYGYVADIAEYACTIAGHNFFK